MKILCAAAASTLENICGFAQFPSPDARTRACGTQGRDARASLGERFMLDVIMVAIGLGFFAFSIGYGLACDRL
jgi:hypothetical protein